MYQNIQFINVLYNTFKNIRPYNINKMEPAGETMSNLKFIGELKKGDKINTKFIYRQPDGIMTRISRTFLNYDNRHNTLVFIKSTIDGAIDLIALHSRSDITSDKIICRNILDDLDKSRLGLQHLKETYSEDTKFKCDMETLIQRIDLKIEEYNQIIPPKKLSPMFQPSIPVSIPQ